MEVFVTGATDYGSLTRHGPVDGDPVQPQAAAEVTALSKSPLATNRCTIAFDFGRAFWRGWRVERSTCALGTAPDVERRFRLRADRLGLRIADRLGQHPVQVSLGRCGGLRHL